MNACTLWMYIDVGTFSACKSSDSFSSCMDCPSPAPLLRACRCYSRGYSVRQGLLLYSNDVLWCRVNGLHVVCAVHCWSALWSGYRVSEIQRFLVAGFLWLLADKSTATVSTLAGVGGSVLGLAMRVRSIAIPVLVATD